MKHIINVKELRASLPAIIQRVGQGDSYMVLYRSKPAFRIVGVDAEDGISVPLSKDPLYRAPAVGRALDGLTVQDHDLLLYGEAGQ